MAQLPMIGGSSSALSSADDEIVEAEVKEIKEEK